MEKIKKFIKQAVKTFQHYIDHAWYLPALGFLAFLDNFLVLIPTDGILISSAMLKPKKWFSLALFIAVGSAIGVAALAYVIQIYGIQIVETLFPGIQTTSAWIKTEEFFRQYGLWLLFAVAATPFTQQPALILAVLAGIPILQIIIIEFIGRWLKYMLMSYIGSHAPHLLKKMWGVQSELEEVGIK